MAAGAILFLPPEAAHAAGAGKPGECLSGPKGAPPQGERWYYRVERGNKRHCWYTRAGGGSPRKSAEKPLQAAVSAKPDEALPQPLQPSVANARAEAEQWPPQAAPEAAPRDLPKVNETASRDENRTWTMAERWVDQPEPAQAAPSQPIRLMKLQVVPAESSAPPARPTQSQTSIPFETAPAETSLMQRFVDAIGGALAILGIAMLLIAVLRRLKQADEDEIGLPPLAGPDGRPQMTWYEPPMDRLRMARHLAELPQPAR